MTTAVVGLGKIGLPIAAQFAVAGDTVVGIDVSPRTVELVNHGVAPFPGETDLADTLSRVVSAGRLSATTSYAEAVPGADVIVVVVPLFVDRDGVPDFSWMDSATRDIAAHLTEGTLVIYETTLPVGTSQGRWKPALEAGSGLVEGVDFDVVFSPERVLTGRVFQDLRRYPKLVGGLTPRGARKAVEFYERVLEFDERPDLPRPNGVWDLGSAETAEMVKLAETTYRDVNIGLANQFALFAETAGIDIYQVIEAANSQPYSHIHRPGIAVGGHCIPVYPHLYMSTDAEATIVRSAREANERMPGRMVDLLIESLGSLAGRRVVVLGAAYRGNVKETAYSGVFPTVAALRANGATALVHDPLFSADELRAAGLEPYALGEPVDAAVLQADHTAYAALGPADLPGIQVMIDGRRFLDRDRWAGTHYRALADGASGPAR